MDRKDLLERAGSREERILLAKIIEKINESITCHETSLTEFLDPHQQSLISPVLKAPGISFIWDGGYTYAERRRLVIFPDYAGPDEVDSEIRILGIKGNTKFQKLSHRDFLGSLMALGVRREKIGDIIVTADGGRVFTERDIAGYIANNLKKVGSVGVAVKEISREEIHISDEKLRELNTTVASLRLDAVAAAGYGVSRSKMLAEIKAEKVRVNWNTINDPSFTVKEGDIISIRGRGRVEVEKTKGETKKGRISLAIKRYH